MKTVSVLILLCTIVGASFVVFKSKKVDNGSIVKRHSDTISNNYLMVGNGKFILNLNNNISDFSDKEDLFENIRNNKVQISKSLFEIVMTEHLNDKDLISNFINMLKVEKITNYKLISPNQLKRLNDQFKLPKEEKITTDAGSVKIEIEGNNFKISFNVRQIKSKDIGKIEEFIQDNMKYIKETQIYIIGKPKTSFERTKPVFDLLKKYDLLNFKVITK